MKGDWGGDDHSMDGGVVEDAAIIGEGFGEGVEGVKMVKAVLVEVADGFDVAAWERIEIADEVWAPVTATDHADGNFFILNGHRWWEVFHG